MRILKPTVICIGIACAIAVCLYPPWTAQWYELIRVDQLEQLVSNVVREFHQDPNFASDYYSLGRHPSRLEPTVQRVLHGELRQLVIPQHAFRRGWLFGGPRQRSHLERDLRGELDWSRLALEEAVVILATALLLFIPLKGR